MDISCSIRTSGHIIAITFRYSYLYLSATGLRSQEDAFTAEFYGRRGFSVGPDGCFWHLQASRR
jgi:hypothetical protein